MPAPITRTLLDYMHVAPITLKERLIDSMMGGFQAAIYAHEGSIA
ncbi:MAG: hypothetical protein U5L07_13560 [Desulfobacterales bacterium]|nr:hypothetical protein [Desulfobacterales bacterium]